MLKNMNFIQAILSITKSCTKKTTRKTTTPPPKNPGGKQSVPKSRAFGTQSSPNCPIYIRVTINRPSDLYAAKTFAY